MLLLSVFRLVAIGGDIERFVVDDIGCSIIDIKESSFCKSSERASSLSTNFVAFLTTDCDLNELISFLRKLTNMHNSSATLKPWQFRFTRKHASRTLLNCSCNDFSTTRLASCTVSHFVSHAALSFRASAYLFATDDIATFNVFGTLLIRRRS